MGVGVVWVQMPAHACCNEGRVLCFQVLREIGR